MNRTLRVVRADTERKIVDPGRNRVDTGRKKEGQRVVKNHKSGDSLSLVKNFRKINSEA